MEAFRELAPPLLNDRHHGVLLSGVTLSLQICLLEPSAIPEYRIHVCPGLPAVQSCVVLLAASHHAAHSPGGVWLQYQCLSCTPPACSGALAAMVFHRRLSAVQVPLLCKVLRSLLVNTYNEHTHEHDVGGVTDPFLQVKVRAISHLSEA